MFKVEMSTLWPRNDVNMNVSVTKLTHPMNNLTYRLFQLQRTVNYISRAVSCQVVTLLVCRNRKQSLIMALNDKTKN